MKVYANHMFVVVDGYSPGAGLQVFDLTALRGLETMPAILSETAHYSSFGPAHNIAINEETRFAYVVGISGQGTVCQRGLAHGRYP